MQELVITLAKVTDDEAIHLVTVVADDDYATWPVPYHVEPNDFPLGNIYQALNRLVQSMGFDVYPGK